MKKGEYWRIIAGMALVAVLACGCGGGRGTIGDAVDHGGSLVSEEGQIAFTRATSFEPDFEADIYTINVDGSGERRVTDSPGLDGFPSWSPDGKRIVFTTDRDGNWELYVMDSDGTHPRRLTNTPEDEAGAAWSPSGEKIAFLLGTNSDNPSIWVMDADGSDRRRLTGGNWPSWSPDGERIAYTSGEWNDPQISVMNADGSGQRTLHVRGVASQPAWSPDGERIAFTSDIGPDKETWDNEEIFAMNPDGSGRTRLTDISGNDHWPPAWSPDSTRIVFTSDGADETGEIYVMNADGSGLTRLTDDPAYDAFPAWRP